MFERVLAKARQHLARGDHAHSVTQPGAREDRVHKSEALGERHADRVRELGRRGAGAALSSVDRDEVWSDARREHGAHKRGKLLRLAEAQLKADGLAARELAQARDEAHHALGRVKGRVARRRVAVALGRVLEAARLGNGGRDLGAR